MLDQFDNVRVFGPGKDGDLVLQNALVDLQLAERYVVFFYYFDGKKLICLLMLGQFYSEQVKKSTQSIKGRWSLTL